MKANDAYMRQQTHIIGSDNGLSPGRRQAIIWINVGILFIWTLRTNPNKIFSGIHTFLSKKMHLKMSCAKWRPFRLGLNELRSNRQQSIIWAKHGPSAVYVLSLPMGMAVISSTVNDDYVWFINSRVQWENAISIYNLWPLLCSWMKLTFLIWQREGS